MLRNLTANAVGGIQFQSIGRLTKYKLSHLWHPGPPLVVSAGKECIIRNRQNLVGKDLDATTSAREPFFQGVYHRSA
jgi:hypothetical protein